MAFYVIRWPEKSSRCGFSRSGMCESPGSRSSGDSIAPAATTAPAAATAAVAAVARAGIAVAEAVGRAVDARVREFAGAVDRIVASGARFAAVGRIDEAVGQSKLGVDREQQRQPARIARVDVFFLAGKPPGAAQAGVAALVGRQCHRRRVIEEAAEGLLALVAIIPGIEDEFVPQIVHHLRGHRDVAAVGPQVDQEELPKRMSDKRAVLELELRPALGQLIQQTGRQRRIADEALALQVAVTAPNDQSGNAENRSQGDRRNQCAGARHASGLGSPRDGVSRRYFGHHMRLAMATANQESLHNTTASCSSTDRAGALRTGHAGRSTR